jgi:hypothetical protein
MWEREPTRAQTSSQRVEPLAPETAHSWVETLAAAVAATGVGGWVIRATGRTARLEQQIKDMKESNIADHKYLREKLDKLVGHCVGADL